MVGWVSLVQSCEVNANSYLSLAIQLQPKTIFVLNIIIIFWSSTNFVLNNWCKMVFFIPPYKNKLGEDNDILVVNICVHFDANKT